MRLGWTTGLRHVRAKARGLAPVRARGEAADATLGAEGEVRGVASGSAATDPRARADHEKVGFRATSGRAAALGATATRGKSVGPAATTIVLAGAEGSATVRTKVACRARRANGRNGLNARTASVTPDARDATTRDGVPAYRRLDRGHCRRHVQWQE